MPRPRSIAIFEVAYLTAMAIGLLGPLLIWPALTAAVTERAGVGTAASGVVTGVLTASLIVAAVLGLVLWWFVARRGSNVARWIAVVALAYSLISSAMGLAEIGGAIGLLAGLSLLGMVCEAVAIAALFRPDARAWFAAEPEALP